MNKKGEINVGTVIVIAILAIVGLILLTASAQYVGDVTNTVDVVNETMVSSNGTTLALIAQFQGKYVTDVEIYNSTDDLIIGVGNYTIYQNQVINGVETAGINVSADVIYQGQAWNASYTFQPTTYDTSGGGRAVAGLIVIFFAIAIAIVMLVPTLRSQVLESMNKIKRS